jgi:xanthine dehydrogenase accessory factor
MERAEPENASIRFSGKTRFHWDNESFMKDDGLILAEWEQSRDRGAPAVLATVVKVSGSAYRSPGARMLITQNGTRTGSVSGGCLEGDLIKRAWWLTAETGAAVRVYRDLTDEDIAWEFGLGCNGVVHVLIERWDPEAPPITAELLRASRQGRVGGVLASVIEGAAPGVRAALFPDGSLKGQAPAKLLAQMQRAAAGRQSEWVSIGAVEYFVEYVAPPVPLLVIGAGYDALPVVRQARDLGWHVTVVDGRANFARPDRFREADAVVAVNIREPLKGLMIDDQTVAVVMSHSYEQDRAFVGALTSRGLRYLGVLGPRKRTERMLEELGIASAAGLHTPVGLDIGAETPDEIAIAVIAEIRAVLSGRKGGMLVDRQGPIHDRHILYPAEHATA